MTWLPNRIHPGFVPRRAPLKAREGRRATSAGGQKPRAAGLAPPRASWLLHPEPFDEPSSDEERSCRRQILVR